MIDKKDIYTVGYTLFQSGKDIDINSMFSNIKNIGIDYIIDVRSMPFSKLYVQCNRDILEYESRKYNLGYIHMPEIGAKCKDMDIFSRADDIIYEDIFPIPKSIRPEHVDLKNDDMVVDFRKIRTSPQFLKGIGRIESAYRKGYSIVLMCSEKNPIDCHRYFLISKVLEDKNSDWLNILHFSSDGHGGISVVTNKDLNNMRKEIIFKKKCFKNILQSSLIGEAAIEKYSGENMDDKILDFCDRYFNILHGWKIDNYKNFGINYD